MQLGWVILFCLSVGVLSSADALLPCALLCLPTLLPLLLLCSWYYVKSYAEGSGIVRLPAGIV